ncbi:pseudaminic acid synthase [Nocardioides sp. WL0053]|uniref:Pseudaminic acid synthase n=1 Tax=Nocardioides jiangsuensis TaxID=2866161 RepID=A0ABS7RHJ7_9ACTN|nr:pseudaminic acid synthase [Nocardioides jiangsuensis]MBY9074496.1 pseudaminic acid synthase [Nocardioides jiangsuensis]
MQETIRFASTPVGEGHPPFIVAEMSGNHNGDLDRALDIVRASAEAGAHALKLQTYTADTITVDVDSPAFRVSSGHELWGGRSLYELYEEAHTPWEWHEPIFGLARELGMVAFSAPFDPTAVAFLEKLEVPAYKVASSEIVDLPLIRAMAETGKPIIISTGMANLSEIDRAVSTARETGNEDIVVLSCTASYPATPEGSNLRAIPQLRALLDTQIGLSDHTLGIGAAVAAVALGATLIEKHVTLDRHDGGVDSEFSLDPGELHLLVRETNTAWRALGTAYVGPTEGEAEGLRFRRSLYVVQDVRAGDVVTPENVRSIRPAGGLEPAMIDVVLGRTFRSDAPKGTPLTWNLV